MTTVPDTTPSPSTPVVTPPVTPPAAPKQRRWPRRVAIGVAVSGALLGGAYWYLGRESTLQTIMQRIANASGGSLVVSGVSGSLYGKMHLGKLVYRTPEQVISADNLDIDWSPFQYLSKGIAINSVHLASLHLHTLKAGEAAKMPATLAAPFQLSLNDARIDKVTLSNAADSIKDLKPKSGVGVGARWRSPVGPINVDVAYGHATKKARLHFSLGFTF